MSDSNNERNSRINTKTTKNDQGYRKGSRRYESGSCPEEAFGASLFSENFEHDSYRLQNQTRPRLCCKSREKKQSIVFNCRIEIGSLLLILFFGLSSAQQQSNTTISPAFVLSDYSTQNIYLACKTNPECASRFFLIYTDPNTLSAEMISTLTKIETHERKLFDFLFNRYLEENLLPTANEAAASLWSSLAESERTWTWLLFMNRASFCEVNQEYILGRGCRCRADLKKGCTKSLCGTLEYVTFIVSVFLVVAICLFCSYKSVEKMITLMGLAQEILARLSTSDTHGISMYQSQTPIVIHEYITAAPKNNLGDNKRGLNL